MNQLDLEKCIIGIIKLDELINELSVPGDKQKRLDMLINDVKASLKSLKPIHNVKVMLGPGLNFEFI